jgi:hypothetical protein
VTEGVAKLTLAISVLPEMLSYMNTIRLPLSIMKRPRSFLLEGNVVSLYVLLSAATTELEEIDEIMRL